MLQSESFEQDVLSDSGFIEEINQKTNLEKYKEQLTATKRFLNMVIHDMRNPTYSTKAAIEQVIDNVT